MAIRTGAATEPGRPVIDRELCTRCGECARVCKSDTLLYDGQAVQVENQTSFGCIGCGHCMMVCPNGSITVTGRDVSPDDLMERVGERATADELLALLTHRRSVREFQPRPVEREVLERIVAMTATAPMGIPPSNVGVVILEGHEKVQELADDLMPAMEKFPKFFNPVVRTVMRPFAGKAAVDFFESFVIPLCNTLVAKRRQGQDWLFYDAPSVMLFHQWDSGDPGDAIIAATYAMVAAESLGLGTCMIGSVAPFLARNAKLKQKWGVPPGNKPALALILGYPAREFRREIRRRLASVQYL